MKSEFEDSQGASCISQFSNTFLPYYGAEICSLWKKGPFSHKGWVFHGSLGPRLAKDISNVANSWSISSNGQGNPSSLKTTFRSAYINLSPSGIFITGGYAKKIARYASCMSCLFLGGGNSNIFLFSSLKLGKIPILTHIFQMGWNHQPDFHCFFFFSVMAFLSLLKVVLLTERTTQCTAASTLYSGELLRIYGCWSKQVLEDFWGLPSIMYSEKQQPALFW